MQDPLCGTEDAAQQIDLSQYWQTFAWRGAFQHQPMKRTSFPQGTLFLEHLSMEAAIEQFEQTVQAQQLPDQSLCWFVPCIQSAKQYWLPLWIPCAINQGKLILRENGALPWIPNKFFSPGAELYLKPKVVYENFLQFECLNADGAYLFSSFRSFVTACIQLFASLSQRGKQSSTHKTPFAKQQRWLLIPEFAIDTPTNTATNAANKLLKRFCRLDAQKAKHAPNTDNFLDTIHLHLAASRSNTDQQQSAPADRDYFFALQAILSLKAGELQAVETPIGARVDDFVADIVANVYCLHALGKRAKPNIVLLDETNILVHTSQRHAPKTLVESAPAFCDSVQNLLPSEQRIETVQQAVQTVHQQMVKLYEEMLKIIRIARLYAGLQRQNEAEYGEINRFLQTLLEEDEFLYEKRGQYLRIQSEWQERLKNHSFFQKCVGWLGIVKKYRQQKASEYLKKALANEPIDCPHEKQLVEKIRQMKVVQAKNDQKRIQAVEFLNQYQHAQQLWQQRVTDDRLQAQQNENDASRQDAGELSVLTLHRVLQPLREQMWHLTQLYWQGTTLLLTDGSDDFNLGEFDYLIIPRAEKRLPHELLVRLNQSQRAVFLGDQRSRLPAGILSSTEDAHLCRHYRFDEDVIERLQWMGGALSDGNAYLTAKHHSTYMAKTGQAPFGVNVTKDSLILHEIMRKNKTLFDYFNEKYHQSTLIRQMAVVEQGENVLQQSAIEFIDVKSPKSLVLEYNEKEIEALSAWLMHHATAQKQYLIVAPFYAQIKRIKHMLAKLRGVDVTRIQVSTFLELPEQGVDIVLFSTVYQTASKRPFVFDEGDAYFYQLLALAQERFIVVGDRQIFQTNMHSASGSFAKWALTQINYQLSNLETESSNA